MSRTADTAHVPSRITSRRLAAALLAVLTLPAAAYAQAVSNEGMTPTGNAPGAPAGSYPLSGFDTINFFNGSLNFTLPLLKVGGRGGAGHTVPLKVENKWTVQKVTSPTRYYAHDGWWTLNPTDYGTGALEGRVANLPDMELCQGGGEYMTLLRLTFTTPDGTEYELRDAQTGGAPGLTKLSLPEGSFECSVVSTPNRGRVFITSDGSGATFVSDADIADADADATIPSGHLMTRDGTRYRVDSGRVSWARDRNGNRVSYQYAGGLVTGITDSLGRTVSISYHGPSQSYDEITYSGFGGASRAVRVNYAPLESVLRVGYQKQKLFDLFPQLTGSPHSDYNPSVVSSVQLPGYTAQNNREYRLRYNPYGELARIELPTGGAIEYDWEAGVTNGYLSGVLPGWDVYRRVVERRVYAGGNSGGSFTSRMTISKPEDAGGGNAGHVTVEQRDQAGALLSKELHYYHGGARASFSHNPLHYAGWREGKEWKTELLSTDGLDTVLSSVEHTWQQPAGTWPGGQTPAEGAKANDPQITQTLTTVFVPGGTNLVAKQAFSYDRYSNRTDVWDYDYGAGAPPPRPLRHTHTDYVGTNNDIDYTDHNGAHIRSLPSAQQVYSVNPSTGAETLVARSETRYDETAYPLAPPCDPDDLLAQCPAVPQWADPGTTARGNPTTVRRWLDTTNTWVETHAQHDRLGNVRKSWDAKGNLSRVDYADSFSDGVTARNTFAFPTAGTSPVPDPSGAYGSQTALTTTTVYDFSTGLVTSTTDANDKDTTFEYTDALDRLTRVNLPGGGWTSHDYGRSACGDWVVTKYAIDSSRFTEAHSYFDGLGRPSRSFTVDPQDPSLPWLTSDTEYDAMGRVKRVSQPYRSTGCDSVPFSGGKWTESEYDALGRVLTITTKPDNAAVKTDYSGDRVLVTDQAGKQRISRTDALGRLVGVWEVRSPDPASGTEGVSFPSRPDVPAVAAGYRTSYAYDVLGNLRRVDQGGQLRFFMYDSLGRLVRARNPEQGTNPGLAGADPVTGNSAWSMGYAYDPNGNLITRSEPRNVAVWYAYDNLGRSTAVDYSDTPQNPDLQRHYDGATNGRGRFWWDFVSSPQTWEKAEHVAIDTYDAAGRPLNRRQHFYEHNVWQWGPAFNVQYTYDLAGNVTGMVYPSGRTVSYTYDAGGRLATFAGHLGDGTPRTYADAVRYHELGGTEQERFGTQTPLYLKRHYNARGQLFDIRLSTASLQANEWDWNRGAIVNYYSANYEWGGTPGSTGSGPDNNGNLHRSQHWVPGDDSISTYAYTQQTYGYDSLNRLKSVAELPGTHAGQGAQSFAQTYDYDRFGNRTINYAGTSGGVNATQFSVDASTNRLGVPAGSPSQMTYDVAGNLTYDTHTGQGTRAFDAEGRMTSAQDMSGRTSVYSYDSGGRRTRRVTGGESVWQVFGLGGELLGEYAAGAPPSNVTKEYGYRAGELLITAAAPGNAPKVTAAAATASNTHSSPWAAANVLDGNAGTSWSSGQFPVQWMQLDLGQSYNLTKVRMLVDQYPAGRTVHEVWGGATPGGMTLLGFIDSTTHDQHWLQLTTPAPGVRYLKVQTTVSPSWVGWREVEVYGSPAGSGPTANLALGRPATQSSEGWGGVASRAVDGNTDGAWGASSVTHTAGAGQEWWQVDLGSVQALGEIRVWNRTDCCSERLSNFYVLVSDTPFASTDLNATLNQAGVSAYYTAGQGGRPTAVGVGRTGRHVRVHLSGVNVLSLAEVEVVPTGATDLRWLVSDQLGTPRMVIDQSGSLAGVKRHDYLPFGEELIVGGRTAAQGYAPDNMRQKFTGYERDGETGLDFAQARYYSGWQGRFTSPDPLMASASVADPQTFNRYSYALNSPYRYADPSGMLSMDMTSAMGQFARNGEGRLLGGGGGFTGALERGGYSAGVRAQGVAEKALGALGAAVGAAATQGFAQGAAILGPPPDPVIKAGMQAATTALEKYQFCRAIFKGEDGLNSLRQLEADKKIFKQDVEFYDPVRDANFHLIDRPDLEAITLDNGIYLNPVNPVVNGQVQNSIYGKLGLTPEQAIGALLIHEGAHAVGAFPPDMTKLGTRSLGHTLTVITSCFPRTR